jgi:hypothetical protein
MATSSADQPNNENLKPDKDENNQQAVVGGDGPKKTEKQLAKEAEKEKKLKKFQEKQNAIAEKQQVLLIKSWKILFKNYFSRKKRNQKLV